MMSAYFCRHSGSSLRRPTDTSPCRPTRAASQCLVLPKQSRPRSSQREEASHDVLDALGGREVERLLHLGGLAVVDVVPLVQDVAVLERLQAVVRVLVEAQQAAVVVLQTAVPHPKQLATCTATG